MDIFLAESAIRQYKKTLKTLSNSPESLITGGMVADVLTNRAVVQSSLSETGRIPQYIKNPSSEESLLREIEQLDSQLNEQAPRILKSIDLASLRASAKKANNPGVNEWWWNLDSLNE